MSTLIFFSHLLPTLLLAYPSTYAIGVLLDGFVSISDTRPGVVRPFSSFFSFFFFFVYYFTALFFFLSVHFNFIHFLDWLLFLYCWVNRNYLWYPHPNYDLVPIKKRKAKNGGEGGEGERRGGREGGRKMKWISCKFNFVFIVCWKRWHPLMVLEHILGAT